MKFFYVYILQSINHNYIYVGLTTDLKRRFKEHNGKKEFSTKPYAPYKLIHYEAYLNEKDAKRREEYLKTMLKEYLNKKQYSLKLKLALE